MYDLVIVGGGPAGVAAGVYAGRKKLRTALIAPEIGGQSTVSPGIQNWIGSIEISGDDLAKSLRAHLHAYAGTDVTVQEDERVTGVAKHNDAFIVTTEDGKTYETKTVLIASGARRRRLTVPGADTFEHKGLTYCATCDGPLFSGMDVVVVGGGNSGFESSAQLLAYAKSVTLLERNVAYPAEPITVEKVLAHEHMQGILQAEITAVSGEKMVSAVTYRNRASGEETTIPAQGVFVEIGAIPNTDMVKDLADMDSFGRVLVDPRTQRTSLQGIWSAGDCTDCLYAQNNIAVGDAVKALEDIYRFLKAS